MGEGNSYGEVGDTKLGLVGLYAGDVGVNAGETGENLGEDT
jgi:hypothetical protein